MSENFELFFNRIKKSAGVELDKELGNFLGVKKSTLSMWKTRKKVDYDLLFTKLEHVNFHWLLTGEGDMLKNTDTHDIIKEPESTYKVDDLNLQEREIVFLKEKLKFAEEKNKFLEEKNKLMQDEINVFKDRIAEYKKAKRD